MSRALNDAQLLTIWERGLALGGTERALLVLCTANPELPLREMWQWPLGRRDALLLDVRDATFGQQARFRADCPDCQAQIEFQVGSAEMRRACSTQAQIALDLGELSVIARAPNSNDVLAAERTTSVQDAAELLWSRCVQVVAHDGAPLGAQRLTAVQRARVEAALDEADPQTDVAFELRCVACSRSWVAPCDVALLLWEEIARAARAVFEQIATLAHAFGWTESQILRLSRRRREMYREMVA